MKLSTDRITEVVTEIAKENNATFALLFGSYARGTATDRSDIDLIFVEETDDRFIKRLDRYYDVLWDRLLVPIEVFVYTPAEFDYMKDLPFVRRALKEGVVLYERRSLC